MFSIVEYVDDENMVTLKSGLDSLMDARKLFGEMRFQKSNEAKVLRLLDGNQVIVLTNEKKPKKEPKKRPRKKKGDENDDAEEEKFDAEPAPKKKKARKLTGYNVFMKENRQAQIDAFTDEDMALPAKERNGLVMSRVAKLWKALSQDAKQVWVDKAEAATVGMHDDDEAEEEGKKKAKRKQKAIDASAEEAKRDRVVREADLLERMEDDGWTVLETENADGKVVTTYQFGLKKYTSLLEVARTNYPEVLASNQNAELGEEKKKKKNCDDADLADDQDDDKKDDGDLKEDNKEDSKDQEDVAVVVEKEEEAVDKEQTDKEEAAAEAGADQGDKTQGNDDEPVQADETPEETDKMEEDPAAAAKDDTPEETDKMDEDPAPAAKDDDEEQEFE
eukprot:CAMPEP_0118914152 /NCGR_PEP_ID=MMETSP1166-20130328/14621_1 /TAXON_ID=1104430 /ORGANISM="Chrysoreinhardia sp, Strain CCMP3193" /LENGTH=390 /DNA_ID=CAMNT_0006853719 /DNA_START=21 /DNA_END=1193 /DNA_ORIENTATION=+